MEKRPHFYYVSSYLGTINPPSGTIANNFSVADGGKAVLSSTFLGNFPNSNFDKIQFEPRTLLKDNYFNEIKRQHRAVSFLLNNTLDEEKEIPIVTGGDHSISYSAIQLATQRAGADNLGVIMFDSHADVNLSKTSPSGNFHGMWARPLLDNFDIKIIDEETPQKITNQSWLFIGNLEKCPHFDKEEIRFIKEKGIYNLSKKTISQEPEKAEIILGDFVNRHKNIYVTFDIDVYNQDTAPATGLTGDWGFAYEEISPFLKIIAESKKLIGADMTEVNPQKSGAIKTIQVAQNTLMELVK